MPSSSATTPEYYGVTRVIGPDGGGLPILSGLSIPKHDYVLLGYTTGNLTSVTYKIGGSWDTGANIYTGGTVVGQLELVYDGSNLTQIVEVL